MPKTKHSEESEKSLERYLTERAKACGCRSLKYYNPVSTGWPDRIVLFGGGLVVWVELKSKGERPKPLQSHRHACLRELGHRVYTCDTKAKIDRMLIIETNRAGTLRSLMWRSSTEPRHEEPGTRKRKGAADEV